MAIEVKISELPAATSANAAMEFEVNDSGVSRKLLASLLKTYTLDQITSMQMASSSGGLLSWNETDGTLDLTLKGGNVTLQVGQESLVRVLNKTGVELVDMQVVKVVGAQGNRLEVALAQADSDTNSASTLAVLTEHINNNQEGFATVSGLVRQVDTSAFTEGAALWLSPTTPGAITAVKPIAPEHLVHVGWCIRSHATQGSIFVHVQNGYEIDELHNVLITNPTNGQALVYDAAAGLWKNGDAGGVASNGVLSGTIVSLVQSTPPNGYIVCDGTYKSTATYPGLADTGLPTFPGFSGIVGGSTPIDTNAVSITGGGSTLSNYSNVCDSIISASSYTQGVWHTGNNDLSTEGTYIQFNFANPVAIYQYGFLPRSLNDINKWWCYQWKWYGSNDNSSWTLLEYQNNTTIGSNYNQGRLDAIVAAGLLNTDNYTLINDSLFSMRTLQSTPYTSYKYYKFVPMVGEWGTNSYIAINEIKLVGTPITSDPTLIKVPLITYNWNLDDGSTAYYYMKV